MISINQFYLLKLAEECAEITQVASKQMQFGAYSNNRGKLEKRNLEHLRDEVNDLLAVIDILTELKEIPEISNENLFAAKELKRGKIQKYLKYSQELGLVEKDFRLCGCREFPEYGNSCLLPYGHEEPHDWDK